MSDAREIAAVIEQLTPQNRKGICGAKDWGDDYFVMPSGTGRGTIPLGVARRTIDGNVLTPLGLAVRAALQEGV